MEFNRFLFPAPASSYSENDYKGELVWVPNLHDLKKPSIPCIFLKCQEGSSKVLLYFHGNAEDIGLSYDMLDVLRTYLNVHILAVEYPGYGLYPGTPSAGQIQEDSVCVHDFLVDVLGVESKNIIAFGRSIGSGPSTYLGKEKQIGAVLLMSAFTSIRDATRDIIGKYAQYLVADRFKNIDNVQNISCPVFLLHGVLDTLIPYKHSELLHKSCLGPCHLELSKDMDHNSFDYYEDVLFPLTVFFENCGMDLQGVGDKFEIPTGFFLPPPWQPSSEKQG